MTCRSVLSTARKEGRDKTVKEYAREINSAMYEKLLAERKNNTHAQLFNIYRAQQKVFPRFREWPAEKFRQCVLATHWNISPHNFRNLRKTLLTDSGGSQAHPFGLLPDADPRDPCSGRPPQMPAKRSSRGTHSIGGRPAIIDHTSIGYVLAIRQTECNFTAAKSH